MTVKWRKQRVLCRQPWRCRQPAGRRDFCASVSREGKASFWKSRSFTHIDWAAAPRRHFERLSFILSALMNLRLQEPRARWWSGGAEAESKKYILHDSSMKPEETHLVSRYNCWMEGCMDWWTETQMERWVNGRMGGWMDKWKTQKNTEFTAKGSTVLYLISHSLIIDLFHDVFSCSACVWTAVVHFAAPCPGSHSKWEVAPSWPTGLYKGVVNGIQ